MERVIILLFLSCSLVAAIHAYGLTRCARNYEKHGCFVATSDQSASMLVYDRYNIQWKNIEAYMHSLACRCEAKARERKYAGFAIHFWGECYGKTPAQLTALDKKTRSNECTGDQAYKGCSAEAKECAGHAYTDFVYKLTGGEGGSNDMKRCNNNPFNITCPAGSRIEIESASYGKRTLSSCGEPFSLDWKEECGIVGSSSMERLRQLCNDKAICSIGAWQSSKYIPCKETPKSLNITYKCRK